MKCPYCGSEMTKGVVQSAREVFFTKEPHTLWFRAKGNEEVVLSYDNFSRPTCDAHICRTCRKVVIDY